MVPPRPRQMARTASDQLRTQTCTVVTRGRRSGAEHAVRVWFVVLGSRFYAASRHGTRSDWLRNALHEGSLEVRASRKGWRGPASLVAPQDVTQVVQAFAEKYQQHPEVVAAWRRSPPTFVQVDLEPTR